MLIALQLAALAAWTAFWGAVGYLAGRLAERPACYGQRHAHGDGCRCSDCRRARWMRGLDPEPVPRAP